MNLFLLIINFLFFFIFLIYYYNKKKSIDGGALILFLYTILSFNAILLFFNKFSFYQDLELFPFIYFYLLFIVTLLPLLKFDNNSVSTLVEPTKLFINTFSACVIIIAIISSFNLIINIRDFFAIFHDTSLIKGIYQDKIQNVSYSGIDDGFSIINVLSNIFKELYVFLLFYYITRPKKNKLIIIGLIYAIIVLILSSFISANRNILFNLIVDIPFLYLLYYKRMSKSIRKIINRICIIFVSIVFVSISIISFSRFWTNNSDARGIIAYTFLSYSSQSILNFNNHALDANGIRYGDRTASLYKGLFGYDVSQNYMDRRSKFYYMSIDDGSFITYIGDFTLDYGYKWAFVILLLMSIFYYTALKERDSISLGQLFLLYSLYIMIMHGFSLFPFSEVKGNVQYTMFILLYFFFEIDKNLIIRRNKIA